MPPRATYRHGDLPDALCAEALRLVRASGAHAFSLRAAARAVGVDVAAVYRHYADKEALLRAVARVGFLALRDAMEGAPAASPAARDRLRAAGHAYVAFAVAEPELFRLMFGPFGAGSGVPLFGEGDGVAFSVLLDRLRALAAAGECARPIPDAATAAWSAVHGLATLIVDGPLPAEQASSRADVVMDVLLAGLRSPAGSVPAL